MRAVSSANCDNLLRVWESNTFATRVLAKRNRRANVGSDQNLIITKVKLRLNSTGKKQEGTVRYEESNLRVPEVGQQFQLELRNRFSILQTPHQDDKDTDDHQNSKPSDPANSIEQRWQKIKNGYTETAMNVLGHRK
ncbi:hypothetical protein ACROYT_G023374 [Oculina patagonica]